LLVSRTEGATHASHQRPTDAGEMASIDSQETLAEMIGTTRSRVSFFMNKFRKLGFIEYNGKLEVHRSLLNMVLHDKPEIKTRDEAIGAEF
jgi:hypothetical protein